MTATKSPMRIASGWYRATDQMTLTLFAGEGFSRELLDCRIVPKGCRFKVSEPKRRDEWWTIASHGPSGQFTRERRW